MFTLALPQKGDKKPDRREAVKKRYRNLRLRSSRGYEITLSLEDKDSLLHGNCSMFRRGVCPAIEFGIVRLILFEDVVNGSEQHSSDSNNRLLVPSALFNRKIPTADFGVALRANGTKSTLNK